jgi:hypothetical protein
MVAINYPKLTERYLAYSYKMDGENPLMCNSYCLRKKKYVLVPSRDESFPIGSIAYHVHQNTFHIAINGGFLMPGGNVKGGENGVFTVSSLFALLKMKSSFSTRIST